MNQKYLEFAREKGKMAPDVYGDADYWALSKCCKNSKR